jgi:serine/threonine protein kinase
MYNDEDKTETPDLNNSDDGATDTYNLNNQGVQPQGSVNYNSGQDPMIGIVLNGYTIESVLEKETGEAIIYLAAKGSEKVVIKHYKTERKPNQTVIKKIMNLDHPDIIKLYLDGTYNGKYYEIMEYAPGGTLADKNSDGRYKHIPMTEDKVVTVVKELVNAFKYFHDKGVIHRDIKPANLFCRKADGTDFLVGDFGISTDYDVDAGVLFKKTETGYKTPAYAAPEQFLSATDKDGRKKTGITLKADYYALGVTVYELLTGINMIDKRDVIYFIQNVQTGVIVKDMLSMPEAANLSPRITKLIQGLMTVDFNKRWGYEQVTDWLNGKDVPVYFEFGKPVIPPLKFGDKTIKSIDELVAAIDADRETGKDYLGRGFFENWAKKFDESLANLIMDVNEEYMDMDSKISTLLFRLDLNRPCKINGHIITKLMIYMN